MFAVLGLLALVASLVFLVMYIISLIKKNDKKKRNLICWLASLAAFFVCAMLTPAPEKTEEIATPVPEETAAPIAETVAPTPTSTPTQTIAPEVNKNEGHIYDTVEVIDQMNGIRTEKIGEISVIHALSTDITDEVLADWHYNYCKKNNHSFDLIVYDDIEGFGCHDGGSIIAKDTIIKKGENPDDYQLGYSLKETQYVESDDGKTLVVTNAGLEIDEETLQKAVEDMIPDDYKGMNYDALLSANDGSVEASLVLDNKSFSDKKACIDVMSEFVTKIKSDEMLKSITRLDITFANENDFYRNIMIEDIPSANLNNLEASMEIIDY